jgi:predicted Zn-ribbon and HTH transcriptional regulator
MTDFDKPSRAEDEYFAKQELERRKKWAQEQSAKMKEAEKEKLKDLHYMKCPKCGMDLATIEFQGIKLDRCPNCNGTWFDAGEVEELMSPKNTGLFGKVMSVFK